MTSLVAAVSAAPKPQLPARRPTLDGYPRASAEQQWHGPTSAPKGNIKDGTQQMGHSLRPPAPDHYAAVAADFCLEGTSSSENRQAIPWDGLTWHGLQAMLYPECISCLSSTLIWRETAASVTGHESRIALLKAD